ncbi:MAG: cyclic nucleotide-binding domain-containing protein [Anaerolineales bacterium]|nr:cyclic nucleotide-binding domain-containing protein [Anaerolineales bacterium]NTW12964.1 cyclic nucleotide-binding domain-containing protein [Anaerolineales bacterium]
MITPEMLAEFDLFKEVSRDTLKEVAAISESIKVKKDDLVFREGERADKLHLLVSGSIALRVNLTSRPDSVTVSFVNRPHQTLGWSGVVTPNHYTASAFCEEDSELVAIPSEKFMQILDKHPVDGYKIMLRITTIISDRLRNSRQALLKTL